MARHDGRVPARRHLDPFAVRAQPRRRPGVLVQSRRVEFGIEPPLWTLALAVPIGLGLQPLASAKLLGLALVGMTALAAAALTRRLSGDRWAGLLAGLAVAITPRMAWAGLSGMEVPLYAALVTLAMLSYVRALDARRACGNGVGVVGGAGGVGTAGAFVAAAILSIAWLRGGARHPRTRRLARGWWRPLSCYAGRIGPCGVQPGTGGRPLPNTSTPRPTAWGR